MDLQQNLLDSHKSVSRLSATVWTLVLVMSIYVAQRSLAVIGTSPDVLGSLTSKEAVQISFFNLGFSYRTMTVVWPGILGALCVLLTLLESKRCRIEESLRSAMPSNHTDIAELDPLHVSAPLFRDRTTRIAVHLIAFLPMIAIGCHMLMIFLWVVTLGWNASRLTRLQDYLGESFIGVSAGAVFSLSTTLFAVLGFFGAFSLLNTMRERLTRAPDGSAIERIAQQRAGADGEDAAAQP